MGHYIAPTGKIYVDTDFVNRVQKLPHHTVNHLGFGEFELVTPDGNVEFDRMRGQPFEGQSGRSHQFSDSSGGDRIAQKVVKEMERHGFSEAASSGEKTAAVAVPDTRVTRLLESIRDLSTAMLKQLEKHGGFAQAVRTGHLETLQGQLREIDSQKRVLERAFSSSKTASDPTPGDDEWKADFGDPLNRNDNTVVAEPAVAGDFGIDDNNVGCQK